MGLFSNVLHEDLLQVPFLCSPEENYAPTSQHLHDLFDVESVDWAYYDTVALDVRNGNAYYTHNVVRHVGGAYGSELFTRQISFDEVRSYARSVNAPESYKDLSEHTWQKYIPEDKLCPKQSPDPVRIKAGAHASDGEELLEFYHEFHNLHSHHIVYLRRTTSGYRLFHIVSLGWHYGLPFKFDQTEQMIRDILCTTRYSYHYDAYDRLLSPAEVSYLQSLASKKGDDQDIQHPERVTCRQLWRIGETRRKTLKWEKFASLLERIAMYGTSHSLPAGDAAQP